MNTCPNNPLKVIYNKLYNMVYPYWLPVKINWYVKYMGRTEITGIYWQFQQLKAGFKNELENRYAQKWIKGINDIGRQPIRRTYIGFKNKFCQEKYIERLNIRKYQQAISRFRVCSHRLVIETGLHQKPRLSPDERLCKYCESRKNRWRTAVSFSLWLPF